MDLTFIDKDLKKGKKTIKDDKVQKDFNEDLVYQYLRVYFTNQREGNSKVKSRNEVRGGGRKPWPQKGMGRARHGSIRSPLWVGGGIVHGPDSKDYKLRLNKKMKKAAFKMVLSKRVNDDKVLVVDFSNIKEPSTKKANNIIQKTLEGKEYKNVLLLTHNEPNLVKSVNNIEQVISKDVLSANVFDLLKAYTIAVSSEAFNKLKERLD